MKEKRKLWMLKREKWRADYRKKHNFFNSEFGEERNTAKQSKIGWLLFCSLFFFLLKYRSFKVDKILRMKKIKIKNDPA